MGAVWQHSFATQNSVPAQHEALYEMFDWAIVALFSLSIVFFFRYVYSARSAHVPVIATFYIERA
jgi:hypothetical protein